MKFPRLLNNISGLQLYQLMRFSTFLFISIIFTKIGLSRHDIGLFEAFMFIASMVSFFWVNGLVQSFLPLYHSNHTYNVSGEHDEEKSPEIFNAFLLLTFFSIMAFIFGLIIKHNFSIFHIRGDVPFINLMLVYLLISNPPILIEYIYLLKNRPEMILRYGLITFAIQLVIVAGPVVVGYPIIWAIYGLLTVSVLRFIWLIFMLYKYTKIKISFPFIREHIRLGAPLILSSLLSGSAQYIDGVIVTSKFDAATFAIFRYGAKELPLTLLLANGLSNAMLPEFGKKFKFGANLAVLRHKSMRLMNVLFPLSMVIMLFSRWLYPHIFNPYFIRSADIFMIYLLLIIPRLVFPQTILIGLKKTRIVMIASFVEIVFNVLLSLYLVQYYNVVGIALATVVVFILEKAILMTYLYLKMGISPKVYIPVKSYLAYSILIVILFVLIDHRIINLV
ncbi:MAG: polysaccharide biosynthesis C-terminal domain-containing protein [Bacteroidales bacterium]|nr:polysaccharide biosynthesis C-terminal domain-containing protein [Bacteroidales bacterium]